MQTFRRHLVRCYAKQRKKKKHTEEIKKRRKKKETVHLRINGQKFAQKHHARDKVCQSTAIENDHCLLSHRSEFFFCFNLSARQIYFILFAVRTTSLRMDLCKKKKILRRSLRFYFIAFWPKIIWNVIPLGLDWLMDCVHWTLNSMRKTFFTKKQVKRDFNGRTQKML